jgi:creatinine amidohydrolase
VIPVAALEQHGNHMPVFTDSMLLGEIIRRVQARCQDHALFLPLMWLGNSHHHMDFAGTVSAEPRVWIDMMKGLVENMISHGFRRILVINGHGGNDVPARQGMFEVRQLHRHRRDLLLLSATYWTLANPRDTMPELLQGQMGHACEWETSMVLRLSPELVKHHADIPEVEFGNSFEPAARAWTMLDRSRPGHIGVPAAATAEKGEGLFQCFSDGLMELIDRIVQWDGKSWNG